MLLNFRTIGLQGLQLSVLQLARVQLPSCPEQFHTTQWGLPVHSVKCLITCTAQYVLPRHLAANLARLNPPVRPVKSLTIYLTRFVYPRYPVTVLARLSRDINSLTHKRQIIYPRYLKVKLSQVCTQCQPRLKILNL